MTDKDQTLITVVYSSLKENLSYQTQFAHHSFKFTARLLQTQTHLGQFAFPRVPPRYQVAGLLADAPCDFTSVLLYQTLSLVSLHGF